MVPEKNSLGIIFSKTLATEQEFNSSIFGLKGKLDATIQMSHKESHIKRVTALELKTGRELNAHRGQVLLYSLLLTERFLHANQHNILLYIMKPKTYLIKTVREELVILIQRRNELAKLQKVHASGQSVLLPKVLNDDSCTRCYVATTCR